MTERRLLPQFCTQKSITELLRDASADDVCAVHVYLDPVNIREVGEDGVSHRLRCPGRITTVVSVAPNPVADLDGARAYATMHATAADESAGGGLAEHVVEGGAGLEGGVALNEHLPLLLPRRHRLRPVHPLLKLGEAGLHCVEDL